MEFGAKSLVAVRNRTNNANIRIYSGGFLRI
jgi:hypothetical protein